MVGIHSKGAHMTDATIPDNGGRSIHIPVTRWVQQSVCAIGMGLFAQRLVAHARDGLPLDDETLTGLGRLVAFQLEDTESTGLPIGDEAEGIRQGIQEFERVLEQTLAHLREG